MKPLLVKGGQKDWNAKNIFSMDYFRSIYPKKSQVRRYILLERFRSVFPKFYKNCA